MRRTNRWCKEIIIVLIARVSFHHAFWSYLFYRWALQVISFSFYFIYISFLYLCFVCLFPFLSLFVYISLSLSQKYTVLIQTYIFLVQSVSLALSVFFLDVLNSNSWWPFIGAIFVNAILYVLCMLAYIIWIRKAKKNISYYQRHYIWEIFLNNPKN